MDEIRKLLRVNYLYYNRIDDFVRERSMRKILANIRADGEHGLNYKGDLAIKGASEKSSSFLFCRIL